MNAIDADAVMKQQVKISMNLLSRNFLHLCSWSSWSRKKLVDEQTWKMVVTHKLQRLFKILRQHQH